MIFYHFSHAGKTVAVWAKHWHEARQQAARQFGCSEQDVEPLDALVTENRGAE